MKKRKEKKKEFTFLGLVRLDLICDSLDKQRPRLFQNFFALPNHRLQNPTTDSDFRLRFQLTGNTQHTACHFAITNNTVIELYNTRHQPTTSRASVLCASGYIRGSGPSVTDCRSHPRLGQLRTMEIWKNRTICPCRDRAEAVSCVRLSVVSGNFSPFTR